MLRSLINTDSRDAQTMRSSNCRNINTVLFKTFLRYYIINPSNAKATYVQSTMTQRFLKNHLNPVMLVFIRKLSLSTLRWIPMCQGFSHFSGFLHHFVLAKVATSSIRVKELVNHEHFEGAHSSAQCQCITESLYSPITGQPSICHVPYWKIISNPDSYSADIQFLH